MARDEGAVVTETTVRTGLVGAGPWATVMHAPLLAGGPGTSLEAVWARREDAATELAQQYGASVAGSFDELLERCDAIAFAVPPDVQAAPGAPGSRGRQAPAAREAAGLQPRRRRTARGRGRRGGSPHAPVPHQPVHRGGPRVRAPRRGGRAAGRPGQVARRRLAPRIVLRDAVAGRARRPPRPRAARARPARRRARTGRRDHRHRRPDAGGGADHAARVRRPGPGAALDHHG